MGVCTAVGWVVGLHSLPVGWLVLSLMHVYLKYIRHSPPPSQAGLMMVGVGNGLTIIFMGLYEHDAPVSKQHACMPASTHCTSVMCLDDYIHISEQHGRAHDALHI